MNYSDWLSRTGNWKEHAFSLHTESRIALSGRMFYFVESHLSWNAKQISDSRCEAEQTKAGRRRFMGQKSHVTID